MTSFNVTTMAFAVLLVLVVTVHGTVVGNETDGRRMEGRGEGRIERTVERWMEERMEGWLKEKKANERTMPNENEEKARVMEAEQQPNTDMHYNDNGTAADSLIEIDKELLDFYIKNMKDAIIVCERICTLYTSVQKRTQGQQQEDIAKMCWADPDGQEMSIDACHHYIRTYVEPFLPPQVDVEGFIIEAEQSDIGQQNDPRKEQGHHTIEPVQVQGHDAGHDAERNHGQDVPSHNCDDGKTLDQGQVIEEEIDRTTLTLFIQTAPVVSVPPTPTKEQKAEQQPTNTYTQNMPVISRDGHIYADKPFRDDRDDMTHDERPSKRRRIDGPACTTSNLWQEDHACIPGQYPPFNNGCQENHFFSPFNNPTKKVFGAHQNKLDGLGGSCGVQAGIVERKRMPPGAKELQQGRTSDMPPPPPPFSSHGGSSSSSPYRGLEADEMSGNPLEPPSPSYDTSVKPFVVWICAASCIVLVLGILGFAKHVQGRRRLYEAHYACGDRATPSPCEDYGPHTALPNIPAMYHIGEIDVDGQTMSRRRSSGSTVMSWAHADVFPPVWMPTIDKLPQGVLARPRRARSMGRLFPGSEGTAPYCRTEGVCVADGVGGLSGRRRSRSLDAASASVGRRTSCISSPGSPMLSWQRPPQPPPLYVARSPGFGWPRAAQPSPFPLRTPSAAFYHPYVSPPSAAAAAMMHHHYYPQEASTGGRMEEVVGPHRIGRRRRGYHPTPRASHATTASTERAVYPSPMLLSHSIIRTSPYTVTTTPRRLPPPEDHSRVAIPRPSRPPDDEERMQAPPVFDINDFI